eukprot:6008873-Pyramimonas_sp.AAC.1
MGSVVCVVYADVGNASFTQIENVAVLAWKLKRALNSDQLGPQARAPPSRVLHCSEPKGCHVD